MCILFIAAYIIVNYYNNDIINKTNQNSNNPKPFTNDYCITNSKKKFKIVFVVFGTIILFLNCKFFIIIFL